MDYQKLSDRDLIQRYCDAQSDRAAFDELWSRHERTLRKYAKHLTHMCPHSCDRELFFEEVFSATQEKLVRKICQYEGKAAFSSWLWTITEYAAIDVRRKMIGRGPEPRDVVPLTEKDLVQSRAVFRDKLKQDPLHSAVVTERKAIVNYIIRCHVTSKEGHQSLSAIFLHAVYDHPVRETAERLGTYERKIYRMFDVDYPKLRASLAELGITNVREVLSPLEE